MAGDASARDADLHLTFDGQTTGWIETFRIDGSSAVSLMLKFEISGTVIEWRGPAPFYFLPTPSEVTEEIETYKRELTYGWGVIPAKVTIGTTSVTTSLIPRAGSFYVPLKLDIRKPNQIVGGDQIKLTLEL